MFRFVRAGGAEVLQVQPGHQCAPPDGHEQDSKTDTQFKEEDAKPEHAKPEEPGPSKPEEPNAEGMDEVKTETKADTAEVQTEDKSSEMVEAAGEPMNAEPTTTDTDNKEATPANPATHE